MSVSSSQALFEQVTIIGVGLLGGSLGLLLKEKKLARRVIGVGRRIENLELAVQVGAIDKFVLNSRQTIGQSDLIVLATPVHTYLTHIQEWGQDLSPGAIVTDVGSVKGQLVLDVESALPSSTFFVGAHPIAGKEKSGVAYSESTLFQGSRCILTPTPHTNPEALKRIQSLWKATGSHVMNLDPMVHDWILGAVSHLPHVVAFALMQTLESLQERNPEAQELLTFSGGGLRDTSRIAASSPEMWRDICLANGKNISEMIDLYIKHLQDFKVAIEGQNSEGLYSAIEQAKDIRERLT